MHTLFGQNAVVSKKTTVNFPKMGNQVVAAVEFYVFNSCSTVNSHVYRVHYINNCSCDLCTRYRYVIINKALFAGGITRKY
mgnify:CR=1